jgi:hypothetical protein
MNVFRDAGRVINGVADAMTATAGAIGGAVVTGVIGGVEGTAAGVKNGLSRGSHSTPIAAATLAAIGAVGLVEWPVLLGVGGGALLVHYLSHRSDGDQPPALAAVEESGKPAPSRPQASKASRRQATA